jgi:hypothetical protein
VELTDADAAGVIIANGTRPRSREERVEDAARTFRPVREGLGVGRDVDLERDFQAAMARD